MPRERYDGGAEPIAEAIRPLVERYGRSFVTYPDEGDSVDNAKVIEGESGVNEKHHDEVLSALYKLANNLSFPKSVVLKALDLTYIADWKLTKQQKKDWRTRSAIAYATCAGLSAKASFTSQKLHGFGSSRSRQASQMCMRWQTRLCRPRRQICPRRLQVRRQQFCVAMDSTLRRNWRGG